MQKKIKVLQLICPTGFYGAERWILTLAKNLDPETVQCDLAVTVEPDLQDLELERYYRALGKVTHKVEMAGRFDFKVVFRLARLIKENGYQIIHTHGYKSDILGLLAARLAGITAISTPHGFENADDIKLRLYIGLGNQFLRLFDRVVPLSQQLCADVKRIGVKDKKVLYIQNGVDLAEVESQRDKPKQDKGNVKRVGFIGQMISRKNVFDLLDVFNSMALKHDDLELKLLGDGEDRPALEAHAAKLPTKDRIEFLGFRNDRLEWLQSFDLFAMTSTLEGIPRCLMEAMAMGIPVAAYKISGIDQLLFNEKTGMLVPLGDKQRLEETWETLLYNEETANKISENGRNYVLENFSGQRMGREYEALFKELVAAN